MMTNFRSLSIRYKILLVAGIALLGFTVNLAFNYNVTNSNAKLLNLVQDVYFPTLEKINANRVHFDKIKEHLNDAVNSEEIDIIEEQADVLAETIHQSFNEIAKLNPGISENVKTIDMAFDDYYKAARSFTIANLEGTISHEVDLTHRLGTNCHDEIGALVNHACIPRIQPTKFK